MSARERSEHDAAWGLEFGDPSNVLVEIQREPKAKAGLFSGLFGRGSQQPGAAKSFRDHPMCANMLPKFEAQLQADRSIASSIGEDGWSLLHQEALSGNFGVVKLFVSYGADTSARTPNGYTAAQLAQKIGWTEIAAFLQSPL